MSADPRAGLRGLYAITPEDPDTQSLVERVRRAIAGGAAIVQYRAKDLPAPKQREQAAVLVELCARRGVPLIVNDSIELARSVGAAGVHLGRSDAKLGEARARLPGRLVGVSCYNEIERARAAADADYIAIGSVFASGTKPHAVRAPLALLAEAKRLSGRPVAAIGGITTQNAALAIEAGADMVAIISAVFDAPDVEAAARSIASLFESERTGNARAQPRAV